MVHPSGRSGRGATRVGSASPFPYPTFSTTTINAPRNSSSCNTSFSSPSETFSNSYSSETFSNSQQLETTFQFEVRDPPSKILQDSFPPKKTLFSFCTSPPHKNVPPCQRVVNRQRLPTLPTTSPTIDTTETFPEYGPSLDFSQSRSGIVEISSQNAEEEISHPLSTLPELPSSSNKLSSPLSYHKFPKQSEYQQILDDIATGKKPTDGFSSLEVSSELEIQEILKRPGQIPTIEANFEGSGLQLSSYRDPWPGLSPPPTSSDLSTISLWGRQIIRHSDVVFGPRLSSTSQENNFSSTHSGGEKDGSERSLPDTPRYWTFANPTQNALERPYQRENLSTSPSQEVPMAYFPEFPQEHHKNQEKSGSEINHCPETVQSPSGGKERLSSGNPRVIGPCSELEIHDGVYGRSSTPNFEKNSQTDSVATNSSKDQPYLTTSSTALDNADAGATSPLDQLDSLVPTLQLNASTQPHLPLQLDEGSEILPIFSSRISSPAMLYNLPNNVSHEDSVMNLMAELRTVSYRPLVADSFSRPPAPIVHRKTSQHTSFNPPAVETLKWDEILPWIPPDRRKVVIVLLSPHAWDSLVLEKPRELPQDCPKPSFPIALQKELIERYLKKSRKKPRSLCHIFPVARPDGKMRLIWNGKKLNAAANPPPPFHFVPLSRQLRRILSKKFKWLLTFDLKSWFVQISPCAYVSSFFGTSVSIAGMWIISGLPMGFSWAPIIAQFITEGLMRRILDSLSFVPLIFVYLDNVLVAFDEGFQWQEKEFKEVLKKTLRATGIIMKQDSLLSGRNIDWLGLNLDLNSFSFSLKSSFVSKFKELWETAVGRSASLKSAYAILSCIVYAYWAWQQPLFKVDPILRLMSKLITGQPTSDASWWQHAPEVQLQWEMIMPFAQEILTNHPVLLPEVHHNLVGVGVSDASRIARAYAFHSLSSMTACSRPPLHPVDPIYIEEATIMFEGETHLLNDTTKPGTILWFCDNTPAIFIARRKWSKNYLLNHEIIQLSSLKDRKLISTSYLYTPSEKNPVDSLSRSSKPSPGGTGVRATPRPMVSRI